MRTWTPVLAAAFVAAAIANCGGDDETSSSSSSGGAGCEPTAECKAYLGVESECLALTDNTDSAAQPKAGLRMAQLTITRPEVLAKGIVGDVVSNAVLMDLLSKGCDLNGTGLFSWLLEFDAATSKLKTGGARPVSDPKAGYCFVNQDIGGQAVAPVTIDAPLGTDGSFTSGAPADLVVPIYIDANGDNIVLLPLKNARLYDAKLSANRNCIGKYNADTLDPVNLCRAEVGVVSTFTDGASLDGFVTLEEADSVMVQTPSESLCVLLSGDAGTYGDDSDPPKCKRDGEGKILFEGDWCSATDSAATADCKDAVRLGASFAASAVTITGDCE